jgi:hypothetical protein
MDQTGRKFSTIPGLRQTEPLMFQSEMVKGEKIIHAHIESTKTQIHHTLMAKTE